MVRAALAGFIGVGAAHLLAVKRGWMAPRPILLAAVASLAGLAALLMVAMVVARTLRGERRIAGVGEALLAAGVLTAGAAGFANWALGIQGVVLAFEREPVRLSRAADLTGFDPGPLADLREMDVTVALARLELAGAGARGFRAVSHLKLLGDAGEEIGLAVERGKATRFRALLLRQGAFGFAPRIVVVKNGREVLDVAVPFRTVREGRDGVSFVGEFEIGAERLDFQGAVTLDDLNDEMKGHPLLELRAQRDGRPLGAGKLRPGESAALEDGYSIAFAGLKRWSEIDFARRTYPIPMLAGAVLAAIGALLWPLAAWRRW